jgi:Tol biopolymer transport system component
MPMRKPLLGGLAALALTTLLLVLAATPSSATFPGGDGKIAFVRANQIYTVTVTGTGTVRLTSSGKNYRPEWSPDGTRIAYVNETRAGVRNLWVMRANGTGKQQVTRLSNATFPSWSPDGRWLAFSSNGALSRVRASAPFGVPQLVLTRTQWEGEALPEEASAVNVRGAISWSPDGRHIAYHSTDCEHRCINVLDMATGTAINWRSSGGQTQGYFEDLDWSPSADRLAFSGKDYFDQEEPPHGIFITLYPSRTSVAFPWLPEDRQLAFSPSGRFTALTNNSSGGGKVYITRADGSGRRFLTDGYQPDWQPRR